MNGWLALAVAIGFEIAGTTAMKLSDGLARPGPTAAMFICYVLAFSALARALKSLEVGMAYAIWSAVGTAVIAAIGEAWFGESWNVFKGLSLGLIVLGVVGLHLSSGA
jgi:small multidrug resistance pump